MTIAYHGYGRLTIYARSGEASLAHVYNGMDDRVATTRGSKMRRFTFAPDGRVLAKFGADGSDVKAEFIRASPGADNDSALHGGGVGIYAAGAREQ